MEKKGFVVKELLLPYVPEGEDETTFPSLRDVQPRREPVL